mgnify:CR=1 FL=1
MANTLPTPILSRITTFDPTMDTIIEFEYSGNQIKSKHIVITNNKTSAVAYESTLLGMKLNYILPKNSIPTGQYTAKIMVTDFEGNTSAYSSSVLFYCFTTPTFNFSNVGKVVNSSNLDASVSYVQNENEPLKEFTFFLYDSQKALLKQSDVYYGTSNMTYLYIGLKNLSTYYIRCVGTTNHGMIVDTGYVEIYVNYIVQPNNMILNLENVKCQGYVNISCNILDIGYDVVGNYILKDGELILPVGSSVTYNAGFSFSDEFAMFVKARKVPLNETMFSFSTTDGLVKLTILPIANKYYCKLSAPSSLEDYVLYVELPKAGIADTSDRLITDNKENYIQQVNLDYEDNYTTVFEVKRKNNLYSLKVYYEDNDVIIVD